MDVACNIIGVLNVTPDSYVDGGKFTVVDAAVLRTAEMLAQGADIIEIGGESTGPGSVDIPEDEELRRVIPVVQAIRKAHPQARVSVDTWKSAVAREAIAAGAVMINDVTAGRSDAALFDVVAESPAQLVLMYAKDPTPRTTKDPVQYRDVVATVREFLAGRIAAAEAAGIPKERLIIDPGMGHFVSGDPRYSFELLGRLSELRDLGCPMLVSPSRKSFLAGPENLPVAERLPGTIAASAIAVLHGASFIRTHDVAEVRRGCGVAALTAPTESHSPSPRSPR